MMGRRGLFGVLRKHSDEAEVITSSCPGVIIRPANIQDVKAIVELWHLMMEKHKKLDSAFQFSNSIDQEVLRYVKECIKSESARIFVAEANGNIIGYVEGEIQRRRPIYPVGLYGFLSELSVRTEWRRKGIGTELVHAITRWFRDQGATTIELFVLESNPESSGFWETQGFRKYLRLLRQEIAPHSPTD